MSPENAVGYSSESPLFVQRCWMSRTDGSRDHGEMDLRRPHHPSDRRLARDRPARGCGREERKQNSTLAERTLEAGIRDRCKLEIRTIRMRVTWSRNPNKTCETAPIWPTACRLAWVRSRIRVSAEWYLHTQVVSSRQRPGAPSAAPGNPRHR